MRSLIETVLSAATAPERWDAALDAFNAAFDVPASCLFSIHEFEERRMNHAWSRYWREKMPRAFKRTFESGGDRADVQGYRRLFGRPAQRFYDELAIYGVTRDEDLPPSDVRDVTRRLGMVMRSAATVNKHGPWIDTLFVQTTRPSETARFLADERAAVALSVFSGAQELGRVVTALRARFNASLSVLDKLGIGVFLVDASGAVIERNREAQRILDQADGVQLSNRQRITLLSADRTLELDALIAAAGALGNGDLQAGAGVLSAGRKSESYDYLVSVLPLKDEMAELEPGLRCAFVSIIDPARETPLSTDGLVTLGDLSSAEAAIVELLVQGFRPKEIADQRDVSITTIRSQLKCVSQKLRCSTQSDIIRAAATTRLPIEK